LVKKPVKRHEHATMREPNTQVTCKPGTIFVAFGLRFRRQQLNLRRFLLLALRCTDHQPIRIGGEWERLVTAWPVMTKSRGRSSLRRNNNPENGLVKPPRRDTRALSPAGMFGEKAPLRLAAQKSRPHAPLTPARRTPSYVLCKWGV